MDGVTKLLLAKYDPAKLQELLQAPTATTKSEAPPEQGLTVKSAAGALQEVAGIVVIMNSNDYGESIICKAIREFNTSHPELMSRSYTLPVAQYGIPVGSWVFITQEED